MSRDYRPTAKETSLLAELLVERKLFREHVAELERHLEHAHQRLAECQAERDLAARLLVEQPFDEPALGELEP